MIKEIFLSNDVLLSITSSEKWGERGHSPLRWTICGATARCPKILLPRKCLDIACWWEEQTFFIYIASMFGLFLIKLPLSQSMRLLWPYFLTPPLLEGGGDTGECDRWFCEQQQPDKAHNHYNLFEGFRLKPESVTVSAQHDLKWHSIMTDSDNVIWFKFSKGFVVLFPCVFFFCFCIIPHILFIPQNGNAKHCTNSGGLLTSYFLAWHCSK